MITGFMAILAAEIVTALIGAHVNVVVAVRIGQHRAHVAVFDGITAAAIKVAATAILARGQADAPRRHRQIDTFER